MNYAQIESYEEARELKAQIEDLFASDGWNFLVWFIEERTQGRERELYAMTPNSIESMVEFAKLRAGIDELKSLPAMVNGYLSDLTEEIRRYQDEQELDQEGEEDNES